MRAIKDLTDKELQNIFNIFAKFNTELSNQKIYFKSKSLTKIKRAENSINEIYVQYINRFPNN